MGSTTSKVVKPAIGAAKRQYPQRVPANPSPSTPSPIQSSNTPSPGPTVHPETHASSTKDETIRGDAADPDFARSLRSLGPVTPSPTFSNSSVFNPSQSSGNRSGQHIFPDPSSNPAIQVVTARSNLTDAAETEFSQIGKTGFNGREFLDVMTIRQALLLRDERGVPDKEIEQRLGLKEGVVRKLGGRGVVGDVGVGFRDT